MKILTWNIWFGMHRMSERILWILDIIHEVKPDIVCLQEVNSLSALILDGPKSPLKESYQKLDTKMSEQLGYWEVCYTSLPNAFHGKRHSYRKSKMCRGLSTLSFPDLDLTIANTHLESLGASKLRSRQAMEACKIIGSYHTQNNLFLGDMNLLNQQELHAELGPDWIDCWHHLYPEQEGFTYDTFINTMNRDTPKKSRIDRMFLQGSNYRPKSMQRLGTLGREQIDGSFLFPSDHFALLLDLEPS